MSHKNIFFIYGEENFLVEEKINFLKKIFQHLDFLVFEGKIEVQELINKVTTLSLFSTAKCLYLKNPWFLTDTLDKKKWEALENLINSFTSSQNTLIISLSANPDQRKKAVTFLKKIAECHEFNIFKDWEQDKVLGWIKAKVETNNKKITTEALIALGEVASSNLRQLASEIEKLLVFIGERATITENDVKNMYSGTSKTIYDFTEAMKTKNLKELLAAAKCLLENGEDPLRLIGIAIYNLRFFYQLLELLKLNKSHQQIASILKKNPYYIQKLLPVIRKHHDLNKIKINYDFFNQLDIKIKKGTLQSKTSLELGLLNFCT